MERRTVFLHCGWRTASTYFWSRFRALDETISYYEPLHESLVRLPPDGSDPNSGWDPGKRGHPSEDKPFLEFLPLLKNGAVAGYHPRFATSCYFLAPADEDADLQAYISSLEKHAAAGGRHAVFGFCRSLGRAAWLKKRFPEAYNIVLTRRPYDHWRSCLAQFTDHRVGYFLLMPVQIIGENQNRLPEIKRLAQRFSIPEPHRIAPGGYAAVVARLKPDDLLSLFLEFYALAYTHALSCADQIVAIEDFVSDETYRNETLREIESQTGLKVTPGTLGLTRYDSAPGDIFGNLDLRRISTLAGSAGPILRSEDAVGLYGRMLKSDIARARKGGR